MGRVWLGGAGAGVLRGRTGGARSGGAWRAWAVCREGRGAPAALFAGGSFTRSGAAPFNNIARWDGVSWSPMDGGIPLAQFDVPYVRGLAKFAGRRQNGVFAAGIFSA